MWLSTMSYTIHVVSDLPIYVVSDLPIHVVSDFPLHEVSDLTTKTTITELLNQFYKNCELSSETELPSI